MKIDRSNPRHWLLLIQQGLYTLVSIVARYLSRRPQKPVVMLYGHQLSGNLKALYQEWERNHKDRFDCYILSLDPAHSQQLRGEGFPIMQCNRLRDMILVGRCDVIITDHGLHAMGALLRFTSILFIDVWHGIPFKGFVPADFQLQHRYDEVWVSSPLMKEIYQSKFGFTSEIVRELGYARTDKLFLRETPDTHYVKQALINEGDRIVLYAPTWHQDENGRDMFPFGESQDSFIARLSEVCGRQNATLVIRSHLNATIGNRTYENVRYCSMKDYPDSEELLQNTDLLICDWSSIAFDFLALDRPTIFLEVDPPFRNGFSLDREYRFGKVVSDIDILCETIEKTLANADWYTSDQKSAHQRIKSAVYGKNTDGKSAARQWSRLKELVEIQRSCHR